MATEVVKTIRASGGDYTSLAAWEAGEQKDLVVADEIAVAECYNDWPSGLSGSFVVSGFTTSASCYPHIRPADGHGHGGIRGGGFYMKSSSFGSEALHCADQYTKLTDLEIRIGTDVGYNKAAVNGSDRCEFDGLLITHDSGGISGEVAAIRTPRFGKVINCIVDAAFGVGIRGNWHTNMTCDNCLVVGAAIGYQGQDNSYPLQARNCIAFNCGTSFGSGMAGGCSNNAASNGAEATPPGANSLASNVTSSHFTDVAAGDYSLTAGSVLIGAGVDLSGLFSEDIVGTPRTAPFDIGPYQFLAVGGGAVLSVNGLSQSVLLGSSGLSQHHVLAVDSISQGQALTASGLVQRSQLLVDGLSQSQLLAQPNLTQAHILTVDNLSQAETVQQAALVVSGSLVVQSLVQSQSVDVSSLLQHAVLAVDDLAQSQVLDASTLAIAGVLQVAGLSQSQQVSVASLVQHGQLLVDGLTQAQALDVVSLAQRTALQVEGLLQSQNLQQTALAAQDVLAVDGLSQAQVVSVPLLAGHSVLAVDSLTQAQIVQVVRFGGAVVGYLEGRLVMYSLVDGEVSISELVEGSLTIN